MKKTIIMLGILLMTSSIACAAPEPPMGPPMGPPPCDGGMGPGGHCHRPPRIDLDKKLKLTDAQKAKAREIRMNGEKAIHPLFEQLQAKQEEKRALLNSNINKKEQIEMIDNLNDTISCLKKQIRDVRIQNTKEFEAILTDHQKKTLDKIKMDARKNMHKHSKKCRHCPPPCGPMNF